MISKLMAYINKLRLRWAIRRDRHFVAHMMQDGWRLADDSTHKALKFDKDGVPYRVTLE